MFPLAKIEWQDEWCLGVKDLDTQHKFLIDIINSLLDNNTKSVLLIKQLINYSAEHFIDEEMLMIKTSYDVDLISEHRKEHKIFRDFIFEFVFSVYDNREENEGVYLKLLETFLRAWFNKHFLGKDKDLATWLRNKGIGGDCE